LSKDTFASTYAASGRCPRGVEVNQQPLALFRRLYLPRHRDEALRELIAVPLGAPL
jgi:hypothetical protein